MIILHHRKVYLTIESHFCFFVYFCFDLITKISPTQVLNCKCLAIVPDLCHKKLISDATDKQNKTKLRIYTFNLFQIVTIGIDISTDLKYQQFFLTFRFSCEIWCYSYHMFSLKETSWQMNEFFSLNHYARFCFANE